MRATTFTDLPLFFRAGELWGHPTARIGRAHFSSILAVGEEACSCARPTRAFQGRALREQSRPLTYPPSPFILDTASPGS